MTAASDAPVRLTARAEEAEAAALADLTRAPSPEVATRLGIVLHAERGAVASLVATVDALSLNRVVGLGVAEPATEVHLDRILDLARTRGVRRLFLQVAPGAAPDTLPAWIAARGGQPYNRWVRLWRATGTPARPRGTDLRVDALAPAQAPAFARVVRTAFGFPPSLEAWVASTVGRPGWRHFGAWDGDMLVATGALFVHGRTGWLGFAATEAVARGRGAQGALIARRLAEAADLGCDHVVTETAEQTPEHSAPSYRNMLRLGFTEGYLRQNYAVTLGA